MPRFEIDVEYVKRFLVDLLNTPSPTGDTEWAISSVAAAGITQGCDVDRYCPNDPVTREQMASFLVRAFLFPAGEDLFTDDEDSVHEADINALATRGVTLGCAPKLYCPQEVVTRQQMAAFLFRAFAITRRRPASSVDSRTYGIGTFRGAPFT